MTGIQRATSEKRFYTKHPIMAPVLFNNPASGVETGGERGDEEEEGGSTVGLAFPHNERTTL